MIYETEYLYMAICRPFKLMGHGSDSRQKGARGGIKQHITEANNGYNLQSKPEYSVGHLED